MIDEHVKEIINEIANRYGHENVNGVIETIDHVVANFGISIESPKSNCK